MSTISQLSLVIALSFSFLTSIAAANAVPDEPADLLIKNARVIDGTGTPWFWADVAVGGDRIVAIGRDLDFASQRTIDGSGLTLTPGFIDIHSHSDKLILRDGRALGKIHQGVTTEVLGDCLLYTSPSPRDAHESRMPSSA